MGRKGAVSLAVLVVLVAVLAIVGALLLRPLPAEGGADDPVLNIYTPSLLTYLPGTATHVQHFTPHVLQRGVGIDGALRVAPLFPFSVSGNPFEIPDPAQGVVPGTGALATNETDIDLAALAPWRIGRAHNSLVAQEDNPQGHGWFQTSLAEIIRKNGAGNNDDVIYLVYGPGYLEFPQVSTVGGNSNTFRAANGGGGVAVYDAGTTPDTYVFTDSRGWKVYFFGGDTTDHVADYQLWKIESPLGSSVCAYVGDADDPADAISAGYDSESDRVTTAYDSSGRRFTYGYTGDLLTSVTAEVKSGETWADPIEVARVDYDYNDGDLELVDVTDYLTDTTVHRRTYYRYWSGAYHATNNPGNEHQVHFACDPEATRRADLDDDDTLNQSYLSADDEDLLSFATQNIEYHSDRKVWKYTANGDCGCAGSSAEATYVCTYETNGSFSGTSGYDVGWCTRTTIQGLVLADTTPSAFHDIFYFDELAQRLAHVRSNKAPGAGGVQYWPANVVRNSAGQITEIDTPASVASYTHSTGAFSLSGGAGLVRVITRVGSGAATGYAEHLKSKVGSGGSAYLDTTFTYSRSSVTIGDTDGQRTFVDSMRVYPVAITSGTSGSELWSYAYTAYSGTLAIEKMVTTEPCVTTAQNGSNSSNTSSKYLTKDGRITFEKDQAGYITYQEYDANGQLTKIVRDANTSGLSPPTGFSHTGTPLNQITLMGYDFQSRPDTVTLPHGQVKKIYYSHLADDRLVLLGYSGYDPSPLTFFGPVSYSVMSQRGRAEATAIIELADNDSTASLASHIDETESDPILAADLGTVSHLRVSIYDDAGSRVTASHSYFDTPSSLPGSVGTHYDETTFGYDDLGHTIGVTDPTGSIHKTDYSFQGDVLAKWIGTSGGNLTKTHEYEYDINRYLISTTEFIQDSGGERETLFTNNEDGFPVYIENTLPPNQLNKLDNLNRVDATALYNTTVSSPLTRNPESYTSGRVSLEERDYDALGRVYRMTEHKITEATGASADTLLGDYWRDPRGLVAKIDGRELVKYSYDRLGRTTHRFVLASDNDGSTYANMLTVSGDTVLEETQTMYDPTHSAPLAVGRFDRLHTYGSTGALDSGADSNPLKFTASNFTGARIQIESSWYDEFLRPTSSVLYGTNGGSDFDRYNLAEPSRSDTKLVESYVYDTASQLQTVTDPDSRATGYDYDDAGRKVLMIENLVGGGTPTDPADNRTTRYVYTDGLMTSLVADLPGGSDDQVTTYTYGTTKGGSASDSRITTGHLLQKISYPDSTGAGDDVTFAYNAQAQKIYKRNQVGTVLEYAYDDRGRLTTTTASTIASGFDTRVDNIVSAYTSRGLLSTVTQRAGSTIRDQVKFVYDGWANANVIECHQDKDSDVTGSGNERIVKTTFTKFTSGRNTVAKTQMEYPNTAKLNYNYTGTDSSAARVTSVSIPSSITLATYTYLGAETVAKTYLDDVDAFRGLYNVANNAYENLDFANRVINDDWWKDLATKRAFLSLDITHGRTTIDWIEDNVHAAGFDVAYTYDDLDRLTRAEEGTRSGGSITSRTRDEWWTLDTGDRMKRVKLDLNGNGAYNDTVNGIPEHDDSRLFNKANELLSRDINSSAPAEYTQTHNAVGEMTDDGKSFTYQWDAFDRLTKVTQRAGAMNDIGKYTYNGLNYRLTSQTNPTGITGGDPVVHMVYDTDWRIVATYHDSSSSPKEHFLYHQAGFGGRTKTITVDSTIARDKDADGNGSLEQRHYYCQNWRGDVSAILDSQGRMVEWVKYSTYGVPFGLPAGDTDSDGDADAANQTAITNRIAAGGTPYDVLYDLDLNGTIASADLTLFNSTYAGTTLGRTKLSATAVANRKGYGGYEYDPAIGSKYHVRKRVLDSELGQWLRRDPLGYIDGTQLYGYGRQRPIWGIDPLGTEFSWNPLRWPGKLVGVVGAGVSAVGGAIQSTGIPVIAQAGRAIKGTGQIVEGVGGITEGLGGLDGGTIAQGAGDLVDGFVNTTVGSIRTVGQTVALPNTLYSLAYYPWFGGTITLHPDGVIRVIDCTWLPWNTLAITRGGVIYISPGVTPSTVLRSGYTGWRVNVLDHEMMHVYQFEVLGPAAYWLAALFIFKRDWSPLELLADLFGRVSDDEWFGRDSDDEASAQGEEVPEQGGTTAVSQDVEVPSSGYGEGALDTGCERGRR